MVLPTVERSAYTLTQLENYSQNMQWIVVMSNEQNSPMTQDAILPTFISNYQHLLWCMRISNPFGNQLMEKLMSHKVLPLIQSLQLLFIRNMCHVVLRTR